MFLKQTETDDSSTLFIESQCSCSLDGDTGFCSSMIGTEEYALYLQKYRTLLANNKCHTMDRFNLKLYKDKCNGQEELTRDIIEQRFNFTYWLYMRAEKSVEDCIKKVFLDSYENLSARGTSLVVSFSVLLSLVFY